jgi:hypothetical protein
MVDQDDLLVGSANSCNSECRECHGEAHAEYLSQRGLCRACEARLHPLCACGCGQAARIVADVIVDGSVDCRAPWLDAKHAREAQQYADLSPKIDVVVDAYSFTYILAAAPCWCRLRACRWCPAHGSKRGPL